MQKDFMSDTWEDVQQCAAGKKIFLFGAGGCGEHVCKQIEHYSSSWDVVGFLDNSIEKQGKKLRGGGREFTVFSPDVLKEYDLNKVMVLICCLVTADISRQLYAMGVKHYFAYYWLEWPAELKIPCRQENINADDIEWMLNRLADEKSRKLVESIVEKRRTGFFDYTDLQERGSEYFLDEFFEKGEEEVFIDGGGYDGDTIEEFIEWTKNKYKKIYTFEPQKDKAEVIRSKLWRYDGKVELFEKGLWDSAAELSFCDGNAVLSGKIGEGGGNSRIQTIDIDSAIQERVTFIKMDIEGAELKALYGAAQTIRRDKPKLAICIYHKPEDMWQIPRYIDSLVPEYKFYIRHFGMRWAGTILYCCVR